MYKKNKMAINTYIRTLYSEECSSLMMYFYNHNLSFSLAPYMGKNKNGLNQYDMSKIIRTTVNYEGASFLYQAAMLIINGKQLDNQIMATLQCYGNTTLSLVYKLDQDNQMYAYLVINKNNESIPFRFHVHTITIKENGQAITKMIQSSLGVFAKTIEGYLIGIGADRHLSKLPEDFDELKSRTNSSSNSQISYGNYGKYQNATSHG